jgi:hypothetical protein
MGPCAPTEYFTITSLWGGFDYPQLILLAAQAGTIRQRCHMLGIRNQDHPKSRLAADHSSIPFGCTLERKRLDHRPDS